LYTTKSRIKNFVLAIVYIGIRLCKTKLQALDLKKRFDIIVVKQAR
jgi:hypothetical protein